ncbi:sulfotransferase [Pacificimonas sp. WHA3]|uniref:Sulfotransferase n=1 Tax=Pacificimonas pallii TaxID=2827236 RepID=A0ABS6SAR9_9SPHN|nr:sulfotransferase [Pacificimonas pallii]MBV7255492.1 sulfotransferase [Pacificimonas pallii]
MTQSPLAVAKAQLSAGQLKAAYDGALQQLAHDRQDGGAWGVMALVALEGGNAAKAVELSAKALELGDQDPRTLMGRGRALLSVGERREARQVAERLSELSLEDPLDLDTVGVLFVRTGRTDRALPYFRRAVNAEPGNAQFVYNLATGLQFAGALTEARIVFTDLLARHPDFHRARLALVQLESPSADKLVSLEARFSETRGADAKLLIGHAAANVAERLGDIEQAYSWLISAKAEKRSVTSYDAAWVDRLFAASLARAHRMQDGIARQRVADINPAPLFVVGMPRSGTTLTDRILSSHDSIMSAGELSDVALIAKRLSGLPGAYALTPESLAAEVDAAAMAAGYRRVVMDFAADKGNDLVVDKMPLNFFYVPHILAALPEARIIMVRRDPRDVVIANYRQLFATEFGYYDYSYDVDWTAHFVSRFNDLADAYRGLFAGPRYQEVKYEDLVSDQEAESRKLIEFAGKNWDPEVLNFHRNSAPVSTASSVQVRSPIHTRSVGRWKDYQAVGADVEAALARHETCN